MAAKTIEFKPTKQVAEILVGKSHAAALVKALRAAGYVAELTVETWGVEGHVVIRANANRTRVHGLQKWAVVELEAFAASK